MIMRRLVNLVLLLALTGCADELSDVPVLLPIGAQTVAANETLRLDLAVSNPQGAALSYTFEGPELPGLAAVTELAGTPSGGTFRWTPLVSHVGQHEFTFVVTSDKGESRQSTVITVTSPTDAAPVFLRPGAGGTYDLSLESCVNFDIEVRDDDSNDVAIRAGATLPEGARIESAGQKRAQFEWCPLADQIEASERWTILLEADDFDHQPTQHSYVIVLRTPPKEGCPGDPPVIQILSPAKGDEVRSSTGYAVRIAVSDDQGLRDAPLLLYTIVEPEDQNKPDLRLFEQVEFHADGENWSGRIPSLGLQPDQQQIVYVVISATDNDDAEGTSCDHTTDSELHTFIAIGGTDEPGDLASCALCDRSIDCDSGICASSPEGARCLRACAGGACTDGECIPITDAGGMSVQACGGVAAVCGGAQECDDDDREEDDTIAQATPFVGPSMSGQLCPQDLDYFRIVPEASTRVFVTLSGFSHADGDLDLLLKKTDGTIIGVSAGTTDVERVEYLAVTSETIYAMVIGLAYDQNPYTLSVESVATTICDDDDNEPDDSLDDPAIVESGEIVEGTICPDNDDYLAFLVEGPTNIRVDMLYDFDDYDLDIDLLNEAGTVVAYSRKSGADEVIDTNVSGEGIYTVRVYGFLGDSGDYILEVVLTSVTACSDDDGCPDGTICDGGICEDAACASAAACPEGYICPLRNPRSSGAMCGHTCSYNWDCRDNEACKWFEEGRACGASGSGQNGAACTSYSDCGAQRTCLDYVGGYCGRALCETQADCESNTRCVAVGDIGHCLRDCSAGSSVCRLAEGYTCETLNDREGTERQVCLQTFI